MFWAFLFAVSFNEWNLSVLRDGGVELRSNTLQITADDISYLRPMDKLYQHGTLYTDETEKWSSIIRSPGYGLWYYACKLVGGEDAALPLLKWMHYLVFAMSAGVFYALAHRLIAQQRWAFVLSMLYASLPTFYSFLTYTLTEALTPAFVLFSIYAAVRLVEEKTMRWAVITGIIAGWLLLMRPALGMVLVGIPIGVYVVQRSVIHTAVLLLLMAAPLMAWQVRHKVVLGSFQSLHPIYQHQLEGMYRLPHQSLWQLVKSWEHDGANFHNSTRELWGGVYAGNDPNDVARAFIEKLPTDVVTTIGHQKWEAYLLLLQEAIRAPQHAVLSENPLPIELEAAKVAAELTTLYRSQRPMQFALVTPMRVLQELVFHSNLPYYSVQKTYRGTIAIETLRWLSFAVHSLSLLALVFTPLLGGLLLIKKRASISSAQTLFLTVALCASGYLYYLVFVQRGIEERYTLPVLAIGVLVVAKVISLMFPHRLLRYDW